MKHNKNALKNMFIGPNKYTVGLIFLFANIAGYFTHMRKLEYTDMKSLTILVVIAMLARFIA